MSRPSFDVAGLWEPQPAPQNGDREPNRASRAVEVAAPPRPTLNGSQERTSVWKWPLPVTCLSVSTTGTSQDAGSSGWSVGFGLVSLLFPFVAWAGGGWSMPGGSVPYSGSMRWAVGAAPLWPSGNG